MGSGLEFCEVRARIFQEFRVTNFACVVTGKAARERGLSCVGLLSWAIASSLPRCRLSCDVRAVGHISDGALLGIRREP